MGLSKLWMLGTFIASLTLVACDEKDKKEADKAVNEAPVNVEVPKAEEAPKIESPPTVELPKAEELNVPHSPEEAPKVEEPVISPPPEEAPKAAS